jgi:hypothetical protein
VLRELLLRAWLRNVDFVAESVMMGVMKSAKFRLDLCLTSRVAVTDTALFRRRRRLLLLEGTASMPCLTFC